MELVILWLVLLPAALLVEATIMPDVAMYAWIGTIVVAILISKGNRAGEG